MIPKTVVRGAHIKCSFGDIVQRINLPVSHGSYILGAPVLIMTDCKVGDNIPCFGTCSSKSSKPCSPVIKAPWYDEKKDYTLDGTPTLTTESFLVCAAGGGIIEFLDSGQETAASESAAMRVSVSRGYTPRFALSIAELASKQIVIPTGEDLPVRDFNEGKDKYVDWDDKAGKGKGIIRIYKREDRTDIPVELTEGEDFYIKDGKAYYYNNVRAILEAQDCNVDFKQDKGKGNSRIEIASLLGMPLRTLYEGTDYTMGNDGKAHFVGGGTLPPGAEKSKPTPAPQQTLSGQTGTGTASSTQTPNDYGFIWPTDSHTVSGKFGSSEGRSHLHRGIDIKDTTVTDKSEVKAIADGKIIVVGDDKRVRVGRGIYVFIDHGNGTLSVSEHLSKALVQNGDIVLQGDTIGYVGDTYGYPLHLHFELLMGVDTDAYIDARGNNIRRDVGSLEPPFNWKDETTQGTHDRDIDYRDKNGNPIAGRHVNPEKYLK